MTCAKGPGVRSAVNGTVVKQPVAIRGEMDLADREELSFYAEGIGCVWVGRGPVKLGHRHFFTCEKGRLWEDDQEGRLVCSWCPACGLRGTPLGKSRRVR